MLDSREPYGPLNDYRERLAQAELTLEIGLRAKEPALLEPLRVEFGGSLEQLGPHDWRWNIQPDKDQSSLIVAIAHSLSGLMKGRDRPRRFFQTRFPKIKRAP